MRGAAKVGCRSESEIVRMGSVSAFEQVRAIARCLWGYPTLSP